MMEELFWMARQRQNVFLFSTRIRSSSAYDQKPPFIHWLCTSGIIRPPYLHKLTGYFSSFSGSKRKKSSSYHITIDITTCRLTWQHSSPQFSTWCIRFSPC